MIPALFPVRGPSVGITWNPSDKTNTVTLSNGNLTATTPGGVRATTPRTTGKYYLEYLIVNLGGNNSFAGLGSGLNDGPSPPYVAQTPYSWWEMNLAYGYIGWTVGGIFFGPVAYFSPYVNGQVMGLAWDSATSKMWVSQNNVWGGNPSAGTGEAFNTTTGTLFPWFRGVSASIITLNVTTGQFSYTPPTGFSAWQP